MLRIENKKNGFTLVEVVVSLVLLGIMGAIVGMGMVNIVGSYFFSARNLVTAQKSTLAISRLEKELSTVRAISNATASSITVTYDSYNNGSGVVSNVTDIISLSGANLLLNNTILTDQVNAFNLAYYNTYNSAATAYNATTTTIIGVNLVLIPQAGMTASFTDRIYIRSYNSVSYNNVIVY